MPTLRTNSKPTSPARSGFTAVELILAVIAVPAVILGFIFINAYVPTLVLQSFGYEMDFWTFFYFNVAAASMGYAYTQLGASRSTGEDAPSSKPLGKVALAYLLHSVLLMLIFGATGDGIGLVHLLVAGLPMVIFWQSIRFAVRRFRAGRKSDESKLITPDSTDKN